MRIYKHLFVLIGIVVLCCACDSDTGYYKHLSKCKPYNNTVISHELAPLFPVPREISSSHRQISQLENGDCLVRKKEKSLMHNISFANEYYLPEDYAKDFGKLMLDIDKYPSELVKLKKDFCKKYLISCDSSPNLMNIYDDMSLFYKVSDKKRYKMISKSDRNKDIEDCKNIMKQLLRLSNSNPYYWQNRTFEQMELISNIKSSSDSSPLGDKEYRYLLNQNANQEWIVEYRTDFSICKAYAYPNGDGKYYYRPVILDPNDKW